MNKARREPHRGLSSSSKKVARQWGEKQNDSPENTPVIRGEWLDPGVHIANVMGWEIGPDVLARIDAAGLFVRRTPMSVRGYVDDDFAIRVDVMSYAAGTEEERARITQPAPSSGIQRIQFASVGGRIYERARELKIGTELPLDMFLQDIPT